MKTLLIIKEKETESIKKTEICYGDPAIVAKTIRGLRKEYPVGRYNIIQSTAPNLETHLQAFPEDRPISLKKVKHPRILRKILR